MPTYFNTSATQTETYRGVVWGPKEEHPVSFFVPTVISNLVMTLPTPIVPLITLAEVGTLALDQELELTLPEQPFADVYYEISIYCDDGVIEVLLNGDNPPITLPGPLIFQCRYGSSRIRTIKLIGKGTAGGEYNVIVRDADMSPNIMGA